MQNKIEQWLREALKAHQKGQGDKAWAGYQRILREAPDHLQALHLSGIVAAGRGRLEEAERRLRHAVTLTPHDPALLNDLGGVLLQQGDLRGAESVFRNTLAIAPRFPVALCNLARLLASESRTEEAIACYEKALAANTDHYDALIGLSLVLLDKRHHEPARALIQRLLANWPDDERALLLAARLAGQEHREEDEARVVDQILRINHCSAEALAGKAGLLNDGRHYSDAVAASRKALRSDARSDRAMVELSRALWNLGRTGDAVDEVGQFFKTTEPSQRLFSQFLYIANFDARMTQDRLLALHQDWARRFMPSPSPPDHSNHRATSRRLRIGFVSPDFRRHSVAFFFAPVIQHLDRASFESFCYSLCKRPDAITRQLMSHADHWHDAFDQGPGEIAAKIRNDRIDILVDLAGFTGGHAMDTFAKFPAPVQITWLGYPNTTGLPAIGYRITDAVAEPPGIGESWNTERLLRLPDCFHCFRPLYDLDVAPTHGPTAGRSVVFGSFNAAPKISDSVVSAWSRILAAVPGARLILKGTGQTDPAAGRLLFDRLAAQGVAPERVEILGYVDSDAEHLNLYNEIDIALDTFPYNGTTTTCEAMWMGVPVVTFAGDRHAARVGASLLHAVGHDELVGQDVDDYVRIAVELAQDRERLARYHQTLRSDMQASPLMDEQRFVRNLEAAYRTAWAEWCATATSAPPA